MKQDRAETVALQALAYVIGHDDLTGSFLQASGVNPSELRDRASDPHFLGAVLDFLLQDDAWVIGFAEAAALAPGEVLAARQALPGGQVMHWT